jgi:hypothetical protein
MIRNILFLFLLTCGAGKICSQTALQLEPSLYILSDDSVKFQGKKIGIDFLENELIEYRLDIPEERHEDIRIKMIALPKVSLNTLTVVKLTLKTNSFLKVVYQIPPSEKTRGK